MFRRASLGLVAIVVLLASADANAQRQSARGHNNVLCLLVALHVAS